MLHSILRITRHYAWDRSDSFPRALRSLRGRPRPPLAVRRTRTRAALRTSRIRVLAAVLCSDLFDRAIGPKDLPDAFTKPLKQLLVGLVERPLRDVKTRIVRGRDDPLRWGFLWSITNVRQRNPISVFSVRGPKSPSIVFLNGIRELHSQVRRPRDFHFQPRCKILAEATWIDEVRFDLAVLEQVGFNQDRSVRYFPCGHFWHPQLCDAADAAPAAPPAAAPGYTPGILRSC